MSGYRFLFDLSSTMTDDKLLPQVSEFVNNNKDRCFMLGNVDADALIKEGNVVLICNDSTCKELAENAEICIGFGGVKPISQEILDRATHATYSEGILCQFLRQLL